MNDVSIQQISDLLEETGELIKECPEDNAVKLVDCIKKIEELIQESGSRNLIYLSYFLNSYIKDVWSNIAVDSSYRDEIDDEDVKEILLKIGDEFSKIGKHLKEEDYYGCYDSYVNLVCNYLDDVACIKEQLELRNIYGKSI